MVAGYVKKIWANISHTSRTPTIWMVYTPLWKFIIFMTIPLVRKYRLIYYSEGENTWQSTGMQKTILRMSSLEYTLDIVLPKINN